MLARRSPTRRPGLGALDAVLTAGTTMPIAAGFFWILERHVEGFFFILANTVGSPLL